MWCDHQMAQDQSDEFDRLGTLLGTRWTKDQVATMFQKGKGKATPDTVMIPLAFIVQPEFQEALKSIWGTSLHKPRWVGDTSEVVEASTLPKEQFLAMTAASSIAAKVQQLRMQRNNTPGSK